MFQSVESKKEEFQKYLEKSGVIDALTKGLIFSEFESLIFVTCSRHFYFLFVIADTRNLIGYLDICGDMYVICARVLRSVAIKVHFDETHTPPRITLNFLGYSSGDLILFLVYG